MNSYSALAEPHNSRSLRQQQWFLNQPICSNTYSFSFLEARESVVNVREARLKPRRCSGFGLILLDDTSQFAGLWFGIRWFGVRRA